MLESLALWLLERLLVAGQIMLILVPVHTSHKPWSWLLDYSTFIEKKWHIVAGLPPTMQFYSM